MMDFKPKNRTVEFGDAFGIDRKSEEYQLGVAQLKEWHERCRANRLGIKRKQLVVNKMSTIRSRLNGRRGKVVG